MAYRDDILAINESSLGAADGPTHYWTMDGNGTDLGDPVRISATSSPANLSTNAGGSFTGTPITTDATNCLTVGTGTNDRAQSPDRSTINLTPNNNETWRSGSYAISFWFEVDDVETPSVIYEQGGGVNNVAVNIGLANSLGVQTADFGGFFLAKYTDVQIETGKAYHIVLIWEHSSVSPTGRTRLRIWLNGQEQGPSFIVDTGFTGNFPGHSGDVYFGNSNASLQFYLDQDYTSYVSSAKRLAHFAIWNNYVLTQGDIDILYQNGAIDVMQTLTLADLPADTSIGLYNIDAIGGNVTTVETAVVRSTVQSVNYTTVFDQDYRIRLYKYGNLTFETDLNLTRFPSTLNTFLVQDINITEADPAVVRAYTDLDTLDQVYDFIRAYLEDNPSESRDLVSVSGNKLDFGSFDVTVDATAASVFDVTGNTITIRSSSLAPGAVTNTITTTGTISELNGADVVTVKEDTTGISSIIAFG